MTGGTASARPRPTAGASRAELEELLGHVRRDLARRDEDPTGAWVEESAADLAAGRRPGWFLPTADGGGLAFYARRGPAAFAHLHAEEASGSAAALAEALLASLPPDVTSLDLGFTGLAPDRERELAAALAGRPGSTVIERQAMDRPITAEDGRWPDAPPAPLERVAVRAVTLEALADLDRRAFEGSIDALLVGREPEAYVRSIEALLDGRLGRFLDEASTAVIAREPTRLAGALLTGERSAHRAIFLDVMVDPARRRTGLGRYLLGWGLRALHALGHEQARLWVSVRNEPAVGLYRAFGFRTSFVATIYRWDRPASAAQPQRER